MAGDGALAPRVAPLALGLVLALGVLACLSERQAVHAAAAPPANYMEDADEPGSVSAALDEYTDNELARYVNPVKRACVRRGGNCDHRPNDCCYNSSCRCNLWGANCRCQRMGLFQKWG
ncbi:uncharacterized protein LOC117648435 [Thrips palmi]|uniref:Uncharacterized protein LOC117648435 n=1 Tax=Thrips palmi TaxID=161013 RepID=A0A6P8Z8L8_THRPL|nr:uncharacterized protein LOC117648435 [Thrips palmi]